MPSGEWLKQIVEQRLTFERAIQEKHSLQKKLLKQQRSQNNDRNRIYACYEKAIKEIYSPQKTTHKDLLYSYYAISPLAALGLYLARRRHLDALAKAHEHIDACFKQLKNFSSPELAAEDLRQAQHALSEITGEFTADDLLGRIFSSFCIGK